MKTMLRRLAGTLLIVAVGLVAAPATAAVAAGPHVVAQAGSTTGQLSPDDAICWE